MIVVVEAGDNVNVTDGVCVGVCVAVGRGVEVLTVGFGVLVEVERGAMYVG